MDKAELPVIDLNKAKNPIQRKQEVNKLYDALTTSGFFYLKGIEGYDAQEILNVSKWFYR